MNVIELKKYKHLAKGDIYLVLHVAKMEKDEEPCVVYEGTDDIRQVWVRPLSEFKTRFEKVS